LDLTGEGGAPLSEFTCKRGSGSGRTYQIKGSVIALLTGDVNVASRRFDFSPEGERLEGGVPDVMSLLNVGTGEEQQLSASMSFKTKGKTAVEIKA
jgi:hypothetical protein